MWEYLDDHIQKLCEVYIPSYFWMIRNVRRKNGNIINLYYYEICFCSCEFFHVKNGNMSIKNLEYFSLSSILVALLWQSDMCIFVKNCQNVFKKYYYYIPTINRKLLLVWIFYSMCNSEIDLLEFFFLWTLSLNLINLLKLRQIWTSEWIISSLHAWSLPV